MLPYRGMTNDAAMPAIIAGLGVGIGFIVVFSAFFTPSLTTSSGSKSPLILGEEGQTIEIDFGVALPERDIIVKKGETVRVPVTIETQGNVEKVLSLSISPTPIEPDTKLPEEGQLALSLDNERVVLSADNIAKGKARMGDNITIGDDWVITDAGFLSITVSPTAATGGPYEYIIEAHWAGEPGDFGGMGSGQLITVTIAD